MGSLRMSLGYSDPNGAAGGKDDRLGSCWGLLGAVEEAGRDRRQSPAVPPALPWLLSKLQGDALLLISPIIFFLFFIFFFPQQLCSMPKALSHGSCAIC